MIPCMENCVLGIGINPGFGIIWDTQSLITQEAQPGVQLPVLLSNPPDSSAQAQVSPGKKIPDGFRALGWEISKNG